MTVSRASSPDPAPVKEARWVKGPGKSPQNIRQICSPCKEGSKLYWPAHINRHLSLNMGERETHSIGLRLLSFFLEARAFFQSRSSRDARVAFVATLRG